MKPGTLNSEPICAKGGRHGVAHILGGTAYGVMHGAHCDVLAVRRIPAVSDAD